jgi:predicted nucleic acid-binding protein
MSGFLLDTNIPSEMTRPSPQRSVAQWLEDADDDRLYFSVVSLGEILKGIATLPESKRRNQLQQWLEQFSNSCALFSCVRGGFFLRKKPLIILLSVYSNWRTAITETLRPWFQGRTLPVNEPVTERWGWLAGESKLKGRPLKVEDGLIAATALEHGLTVVTRNVKDFEGLGVTILNPWN